MGANSVRLRQKSARHVAVRAMITAGAVAKENNPQRMKGLHDLLDDALNGSVVQGRQCNWLQLRLVHGAQDTRFERRPRAFGNVESGPWGNLAKPLFKPVHS